MNIIKAIGSVIAALVLVVFIIGMVVLSTAISWILLIGVLVWLIASIIYNLVKKRKPPTKK